MKNIKMITFLVLCAAALELPAPDQRRRAPSPQPARRASTAPRRAPAPVLQKEPRTLAGFVTDITKWLRNMFSGTEELQKSMYELGEVAQNARKLNVVREVPTKLFKDINSLKNQTITLTLLNKYLREVNAQTDPHIILVPAITEVPAVKEVKNTAGVTTTTAKLKVEAKKAEIVPKEAFMHYLVARINLIELDKQAEKNCETDDLQTLKYKQKEALKKLNIFIRGFLLGGKGEVGGRQMLNEHVSKGLVAENWRELNKLVSLSERGTILTLENAKKLVSKFETYIKQNTYKTARASYIKGALNHNTTQLSTPDKEWHEDIIEEWDRFNSDEVGFKFYIKSVEDLAEKIKRKENSTSTPTASGTPTATTETADQIAAKKYYFADANDAINRTETKFSDNAQLETKKQEWKDCENQNNEKFDKWKKTRSVLPNFNPDLTALGRNAKEYATSGLTGVADLAKSMFP